VSDAGGAGEEHPLLLKFRSNVTGKPRKVVFDDDLIPDPGSPDRERDDGLDTYLDDVGIVAAYNRWAGKGTVDAGVKVESIKVRCPNPLHEDNHPSAWLNTQRGPGGVGVCRACGDLGFDKFTIFAWNKGLTPPGHPIGTEFPAVRRAMAQELGATVMESGGKSFVVGPDPAASEVAPGDDGDRGTAPVESVSTEGAGGGVGMAGDTPDPPRHPLLEKMASHDPLHVSYDSAEIKSESVPDDRPEGVETPDPLPESDSDGPTATVHSIKTGKAIGWEPPPDAPTIDWEAMVQPGTFLYEWMDGLTARTDIPHEYILFNGLVALGAVVKRNVYFAESRFVYPNLMVILFGDTSSGKSRSFDPLVKILRDVDPYVDDDMTLPPHGTKYIGSFGSGEALINGVRKDLLDPTTKVPVETVGVSALSKMEEFSLTMALARRSGSTFKEYLMSIYDTGSASHTSLASGDLSVTGAYLQVISTTQPDAVYEFLRASDAFSGFLNRWVMVSGPNRNGKPLSIQPPLPDLSIQAALLTDVRDWASSGRRMMLEGEPFEEWDRFYAGGLERVQAEGSPLLARWDLTLKKIILLLTANEMLDQPSVEIVRAVTEHVFPYMRNVYAHFGEKMADNDRERVFEDAIKYVESHHKRHKAWPTVRDMKKSSVGKRHGGMKVVEACDWAAKMGLIGKIVTSHTTRYATINE
jgi:hypothetical protein